MVLTRRSIVATAALGALACSSMTGLANAVSAGRGWDELHRDLHECTLSSSYCQEDETSRVLAGHNKGSCERTEGLTWHASYETPEDLSNAVHHKNATMSMEDMEAMVFIVQVSDQHHANTAVQERWALTIGVQLGDYIRCGPDGTRPFLYGFGTHEQIYNAMNLQEVSPVTGELSLVFDVVVPFPDRLKMSPELQDPVHHEDDVHVEILLSLCESCSGSETHAKEIGHRLQRRLAASDLSNGHQVTMHRRDLLSVTGVHVRELQDAHTLFSTHPEIHWVEPHYKYSTNNLDAAYRLQSGTILPISAGGSYPSAGKPFEDVGIDGTGVIVGIGDSGLDHESCHFRDEKSRLSGLRPGNVYNIVKHRKIVQYSTFADGAGGSHGTHVAGTVAGDGSPAGASSKEQRNKGIAPKAKIAFFDIGDVAEDAQGSLRVPADFGRLFRDAYSVGAKIHTNSWGARSNSYNRHARDADTFSYQNQDFLVLVAAGNFGQKLNGSPVGTLGAPATSKSCVSVGAAQNSGHAWSLLRDRNGSPQACPTPGECAESMAEFSSDGPAQDGRISPDVVTAGSYIVSAANGVNCGSLPQAGTSMATPAVAGASALVRQYFEMGYYPFGEKSTLAGFNPMGALVKAILVNSGQPLSGVYNGQPLEATPSMEQGFGSVTLSDSLPLSNSDVKIFVDGDASTADSMPTFQPNGETTKVYKFMVDRSKNIEFKATLVWHDAPANQNSAINLVNDLDITVTAAGNTFYPNNKLEKDSLNVVEQVIVIPADLPADGVLTVTITAATVQSTQPFALAVRGALLQGNAPDVKFPVRLTGGIVNSGTDSTDGAEGGDFISSVGGMPAFIGIAVAGVASIGIVAFVATNKEPAKKVAKVTAPVRNLARASMGAITGFGGGAPGPRQSSYKLGQASSTGLPQGWSVAMDPTSGQPYYFTKHGTKTAAPGSVQWHRPK